LPRICEELRFLRIYLVDESRERVEYEVISVYADTYGGLCRLLIAQGICRDTC
jgi:hypothetical protein